MNDVELTLANRRQWGCTHAPNGCLEFMKPLPAKVFDLVFFSPPYADQRTYGVKFKLKGQAWVDWMRPIVVEAARLSKGLVVINMSSPLKQSSYQAEVEWLVADLMRLDGLVCGPSPYAWVKSQNHEEADGNGIPGSGGYYYQRRDWEPLYAFCLKDRLPGKNGSNPGFWSDNTAFGHPPKFGPGGEMSTRMVNGERVNDPWKTASRGPGVSGRTKDGAKKVDCGSTRRNNGVYKDTRRHTNRVSSGDMKEQTYTPAEITNPGNVIRAAVGGGKQGHKKAHDSEAPMSLGVAERFICWYVPPGGIVFDPFCGSGTTLHAALNHGRRAAGCDLRESQVVLTQQRLRGITPAMF